MATTTFEKPMGSEVETLKGQIGTLSTLTTTNKQSAVSAINEINSKINNLIKYADVSSVSFACTTADGGHYYGEVDRGTLGLSGKMLVFAQFTGSFTSDEILSITSSSHKVCMITDSSKSVTRNIRVFYMSE